MKLDDADLQLLDELAQLHAAGREWWEVSDPRAWTALANAGFVLLGQSNMGRRTSRLIAAVSPRGYEWLAEAAR